MAVISLGKRQKLLKRVDKSMCCMQQTDAPMQQICQSFVARHAHAPRHPLAHLHTHIHTHRYTGTICSCHLSGCRLKQKQKRKLKRSSSDACPVILKINRAEGIILLSPSPTATSLPLSPSLLLFVMLQTCLLKLCHNSVYAHDTSLQSRSLSLSLSRPLARQRCKRTWPKDSNNKNNNNSWTNNCVIDA